MPVEFFTSALVTLLVVVDPIAVAPIFLAITEGLPRRARHHVAWRASAIAAGILIAVALGGDWLLRQLAISMPAFRIAGGLLLFSIAFEMVFGVRSERQARAAEQAVEEHTRVRNLAAFPLGIPLLAGPGAITATVLLAGQADMRLPELAALIGAILLVALACLVSLRLASRIDRLLGVTGNLVASRLLGVVLTALAVQYVVDGVRAVMAG
jgi:multiple antibiotic resistance protein